MLRLELESQHINKVRVRVNKNSNVVRDEIYISEVEEEREAGSWGKVGGKGYG